MYINLSFAHTRITTGIVSNLWLKNSKIIRKLLFTHFFFLSAITHTHTVVVVVFLSCVFFFFGILIPFCGYFLTVFPVWTVGCVCSIWNVITGIVAKLINKNTQTIRHCVVAAVAAGFFLLLSFFSGLG